MIKPISPLPLGLPSQIQGEPTLQVDLGDDTQERFRYQHAIGVILLSDGLMSANSKFVAIWCEHHGDFLIELTLEQYIAVQVKTDGNKNALWRNTDAAFISSLERFGEIESKYGEKIVAYEFCSNARPYVPGEQAE